MRVAAAPGIRRDSADVAVALGNLYAVLKRECFLPAAETDRIPKPDSTISLKRWWRDGGRDWLASYLKLPMQGDVGAARPYVALPPDVARDTAQARRGRRRRDTEDRRRCH